MPANEKIHFELVSAAEQPARSLIVMFHGAGQTTKHILPHAHELHKSLPGTDIICPLGPEPFSSKKYNIRREAGLRTWFKHETPLDVAKMHMGLIFNRIAILDHLHALIDRELAARNLDDNNLALFGFSLGGSIALMTSFTRASAPAAAVAHSGMFFRFNHIETKPPTLWIMGDGDLRYDVNKNAAEKRRNGIISKHFNYFHCASVERLERAGVPVETKIIPGLGHDIGAESLQQATIFLKQHLEKK